MIEVERDFWRLSSPTSLLKARSANVGCPYQTCATVKICAPMSPAYILNIDQLYFHTRTGIHILVKGKAISPLTLKKI